MNNHVVGFDNQRNGTIPLHRANHAPRRESLLGMGINFKASIRFPKSSQGHIVEITIHF